MSKQDELLLASKLRENIKLILKQIPRDILKYLYHPDDAPSYDDYINQILAKVRRHYEQKRLDRPFLRDIAHIIALDAVHHKGEPFLQTAKKIDALYPDTEQML